MGSGRKEVIYRFVVAFCLLCRLCSSEIIEIENGKIEGILMQTRNVGETFHAFFQIPFAEPPVNELRFKAPVAKEKWTDVRNYTTFGPICMQALEWGREQSEDCLHLNVFTKNLPTVESTELKPVIAFIHGGAFEIGSAAEHGPEYLMERDIVLVTIQYRLGAFGFLALETSEVSGNQGLKDQTMALKWIQKNIRLFGGDPDRVTIAGLSAGAFSTTAHMLSPMSDGLFKNVIAMSGALAFQMKLKTTNFGSALRMAMAMNCPFASTESILQCFMNKSAEDIATYMTLQDFPCTLMIWAPVVERDFGQERFLTDEPNTLLQSGNFSRVNVMVGITADEFLSPVKSIIENSTVTDYFNDNFITTAPSCFGFEETNFRTNEEIAKTLRKSYLPFDTIDVRSFNSLNHFFADSLIGYGVHRFVHYVSNLTDVYYYKMSFIGRYSTFNYPHDKPYGVQHGDDIQYLFPTNYVGPMIQLNDPENIAVERMTRIWEQFARTGNPNNSTDEIIGQMNWPKHDSVSEFYLDIGTHLVEKNGLYLERFAVWDSFEVSSSGSLKTGVGLIAILLIKFVFKLCV